jgi:hypothetical protein
MFEIAMPNKIPPAPLFQRGVNVVNCNNNKYPFEKGKIVSITTRMIVLLIKWGKKLCQLQQ